MITSRRDYMMRILEELGRLLARVTAKRRKGDSDDTALETVVFGLQRLFGLEASQIFLLTPDEHFTRLCDDDLPEFARDKVLMYAALSAEAGYVYARQGNTAMARATFLNALRFTLKARAKFEVAGWPDYAPKIDALLVGLGNERLDPVTDQLLAEDRARSAQANE